MHSPHLGLVNPIQKMDALVPEPNDRNRLSIYKLLELDHRMPIALDKVTDNPVIEVNPPMFIVRHGRIGDPNEVARFAHRDAPGPTQIAPDLCLLCDFFLLTSLFSFHRLSPLGL